MKPQVVIITRWAAATVGGVSIHDSRLGVRVVDVGLGADGLGDRRSRKGSGKDGVMGRGGYVRSKGKTVGLMWIMGKGKS